MQTTPRVKEALLKHRRFLYTRDAHKNARKNRQLEEVEEKGNVDRKVTNNSREKGNLNNDQ